MHRCLVLNATYEYLCVLDQWIDALGLQLAGKAEALASYPKVVRSVSASFPLPAVLVMRYVVQTQRRRSLFEAPSKRIILARDGFACQYCGARLSLGSGTRDHVLPRSRGGGDTLANVVAACQGCNRRKKDRTPAEAGMPLRAAPRSLSEDEKLACLLRGVRSDERAAWLACLRRHGITLWTARAA